MDKKNIDLHAVYKIRIPSSPDKYPKIHQVFNKMNFLLDNADAKKIKQLNNEFDKGYYNANHVHTAYLYDGARETDIPSTAIAALLTQYNIEENIKNPVNKRKFGQDIYEIIAKNIDNKMINVFSTQDELKDLSSDEKCYILANWFRKIFMANEMLEETAISNNISKFEAAKQYTRGIEESYSYMHELFSKIELSDHPMEKYCKMHLDIFKDNFLTQQKFQLKLVP